MSDPSRIPVTVQESSNVVEAAVKVREPVEWWYVNTQINAPGTPIDGCALVVSFNRFAGVIEEVRRLLVSPERGTIANFGTGRLAFDSITASTEELDVRHEGNVLRGGYPNYQLTASGESDGVVYAAEMSYTADVEPEKLTYINGQLHHFVVYRLNATGTVTIGPDTYEVSGLAYYEHHHGRFGSWSGDSDAAPVDGWNWYWTPASGPDGVALQIIDFDSGDNDLAFSSVSSGGSVVRFDSVTEQTLEERTVNGIPYAHQLRFTGSSERGELDVVVTRKPAAHRTATSRRARSGTFFLTGFAEIEGSVKLDGANHVLAGKVWGSVFRTTTSEGSRNG